MEPAELLALLDTALSGVKRLREMFYSIDFKALRRERSQSAMSYDTRVPQSTLSRLENGFRPPMSIELMATILRAYTEAPACKV